MKKMISILLALMLATALTACSQSAQSPTAGAADTAGDGADQTPVTLTILHEHSVEAAENIVSSAGFRAMLDKYIEEHPWVTLEETTMSNADIGDKYQALIAADELPDISYVSYNWLENIAGNNMVADLTDYVNPDDYVDGLYSVTYNGRVYGMPNKYSVYNFILYNEELWQEAGYDSFPATLDELLAAGEYFRGQGVDTISLGNTAKWFAVSYFASPLLYDYLGNDWVESMIACDGTGSWTDQGFIDAMGKLQQMSALFNNDFNMQDDMWAMGWYMQGNSAAHAVGGWGLDTAKNMGAEYPEVWEKTRVALLPTANGSQPTMVSAVGAAVGVNAKLTGAEFDAALAVCQQISSQDYAQFMAARASTTPVKVDLDFTGHGRPYEDFAEILNNTASVGLNFNDYFRQDIVSAMQAESQSMLAGATTPAQVAANLQLVQDNIEQNQ